MARRRSSCRCVALFWQLACPGSLGARTCNLAATVQQFVCCSAFVGASCLNEGYNSGESVSLRGIHCLSSFRRQWFRYRDLFHLGA